MTQQPPAGADAPDPLTPIERGLRNRLAEGGNGPHFIGRGYTTAVVAALDELAARRANLSATPAESPTWGQARDTVLDRIRHLTAGLDNTHTMEGYGPESEIRHLVAIVPFLEARAGKPEVDISPDELADLQQVTAAAAELRAAVKRSDLTRDHFAGVYAPLAPALDRLVNIPPVARPDRVTLSARVDPETRRRVLEDARQGEDQSAALRRIIAAGLTVSEEGSLSDALDRHGVPPCRDDGEPATVRQRVDLALDELARLRGAEQTDLMDGTRALGRYAIALNAVLDGMGVPPALNPADRLLALDDELQALRKVERDAAAALERRAATESDRAAVKPRRAPLKNPPSRTSQAYRALEFIVDIRGARGATADDVARWFERTRGRAQINGIARRLADLDEAGAIQPLVLNGDPVTRPTRTGRAARVYVATTLGRAWINRTKDQIR